MVTWKDSRKGPERLKTRLPGRVLESFQVVSAVFPDGDGLRRSVCLLLLIDKIDLITVWNDASGKATGLGIGTEFGNDWRSEMSTCPCCHLQSRSSRDLVR